MLRHECFITQGHIMLFETESKRRILLRSSKVSVIRESVPFPVVTATWN